MIPNDILPQSQPSSEKLLPVEYKKEYRNPQPDITQRQTLEHTALNRMFHQTPPLRTQGTPRKNLKQKV